MPVAKSKKAGKKTAAKKPARKKVTRKKPVKKKIAKKAAKSITLKASRTSKTSRSSKKSGKKAYRAAPKSKTGKKISKSASKKTFRAPVQPAPKPPVPTKQEIEAAKAARKRERDMYRIYEEGLRLLHQKKYRKAHGALTQLVRKFPDETEVIARVKSFLRVCERHLEARDDEGPNTAEEVFNQGVIYHNASQFEEALDSFSRALKLARQKKDHIYYALAATELCLGNIENALKHLEKAIEMNDDNRFFAHNDPDFAPLAANQKFRELVQRN